MSIVILVTADTARLDRCLESLRNAASREDPATEVVVLANGTPSSALQDVAARDDVVLIRSPVNHGFGGGCNWAARFTAGDRLVFLNDDVTVTPGWLNALNRRLDSDPRVGVVGSRVLLPDGRLQEAGSVIWRDGTVWGLGRLLSPDDPRFQAAQDVDYVSFCAAMVRRRAWDAVGGFDERYFPAYYEDADLCLELHQRGWRVVCEPASMVVHEEGVSTPLRLREFLGDRNRRQFVAKWSGVISGLPPRPPDHDPLVMSEEALRSMSRRAALLGVGVASRDRPVDRGAHLQPQAPGPPAGLEDPDETRLAPLLEARHLAAAVEVRDEYIAALQAEIDGMSTARILHRRYRGLRHRVGLQVQRHARLARAVSAVRGRIAGSRLGAGERPR